MGARECVSARKKEEHTPARPAPHSPNKQNTHKRDNAPLVGLEVFALLAQARHVVGVDAEHKHVFLAALLGDLDVGAVHGADDEAAVHLELHVARAARLVVLGFVVGWVG